MPKDNEMKPIERFAQRNYTMKLRMPEGTRFIRADNAEDIRSALERGLAAFVQSCDGRAFVWKEGASWRVDHFFIGPAHELDFDSEEEAADYASGLCE